MNPPYTFHLPNEKKGLYDRLAVFMFLLNAAVLLIRFTYFRDSITGSACQLFLYITAGCGLVLLLSMVWRRQVRRLVKLFAGAAIYLTLFWLLTAPWWAGVLNLLLIFLYIASQRELLIRVDRDGVRYPSLPPAKIRWEELSNLVLKDGLLTIDLTNDTLIQVVPDAKMNLPDERDFNEFCRERLGRKFEALNH